MVDHRGQKQDLLIERHKHRLIDRRKNSDSIQKELICFNQIIILVNSMVFELGCKCETLFRAIYDVPGVKYLPYRIYDMGSKYKTLKLS